MSRFSVEIFLSHSTETFRRGTLLCLCFRKLPLAKKFMDKREGDLSRLPLKIFCLTVPKNFVGQPFSVSLMSGMEKILCFRGLCHDFPSKFFCLRVPKNFVGETFCAVYQKISGSEKVYG